MAKILIALTDRDEAIRTSKALEERGDTTYIATDSSALLENISHREFNALILDTDIIPELELNIVKFVRERTPGLKIILATAREKLDLAVNLARKQDFYYLLKPLNINELYFMLEKIENASASIEAPVQDLYFREKFIGKSDKIRKVMEISAKVAKSESNILITGETGTGKELISRAIHELSHRAHAPFIAVNCAAIPENLLESELFGYKKGAFSGAVADKRGLIELADKGTLFLDEIGDLSLNLQSKLLRVLEYRELRMLGDETVKNVDIRIIAATNQDLAALMREKKFREDLFFRLNVININIPPLRERKEDIPLLIRFFIEKYNKLGGRSIVSIDPRARKLLEFYNYPGNVRELDNIIQHAFAMAHNDILEVEDLPVHLQNITPYFELESHEDVSEKIALENGGASDLLLSEIEKNTIIKGFSRFAGNHTMVAKALGISRSTLWRKMKQYKIQT
jgi:DNA-binding NtrC family response regulator